MQKTIQFLFLFSGAVLTACGGEDSDPPTTPPGGGTPQTVTQIYEAMDPLCGPVAMAIGLTSNETQLTYLGPTLWERPEAKPAPFVGLYYIKDGWPTALLKTAQLGGAYGYYEEQIVATSQDAANMCSAVHSIIFPRDVTTDRRAYSNVLFYLSGFNTPSEPWNLEIGSQVFDADIEMVLSYATGVEVVDSNKNVTWNNQDHQYLSMKVECDQPFQVEQVFKGVLLDSPESFNLSPKFCHVNVNLDNKFFSCLGLKGVYSGNQCTYVVEDQPYTPVNSSEELTVNFGGTITLAPEEEWPGRPAYRMTIDRFKL